MDKLYAIFTHEQMVCFVICFHGHQFFLQIFAKCHVNRTSRPLVDTWMVRCRAAAHWGRGGGAGAVGRRRCRAHGLPRHVLLRRGPFRGAQPHGRRAGWPRHVSPVRGPASCWQAADFFSFQKIMAQCLSLLFMCYVVMPPQGVQDFGALRRIFLGLFFGTFLPPKSDKTAFLANCWTNNFGPVLPAGPTFGLPDCDIAQEGRGVSSPVLKQRRGPIPHLPIHRNLPHPHLMGIFLNRKCLW